MPLHSKRVPGFRVVRHIHHTQVQVRPSREHRKCFCVTIDLAHYAHRRLLFRRSFSSSPLQQSNLDVSFLPIEPLVGVGGLARTNVRVRILYELPFNFLLNIEKMGSSVKGEIVGVR